MWNMHELNNYREPLPNPPFALALDLRRDAVFYSWLINSSSPFILLNQLFCWNRNPSQIANQQNEISCYDKMCMKLLYGIYRSKSKLSSLPHSESFFYKKNNKFLNLYSSQHWHPTGGQFIYFLIYVRWVNTNLIYIITDHSYRAGQGALPPAHLHKKWRPYLSLTTARSKFVFVRPSKDLLGIS